MLFRINLYFAVNRVEFLKGSYLDIEAFKMHGMTKIKVTLIVRATYV